MIVRFFLGFVNVASQIDFADVEPFWNPWKKSYSITEYDSFNAYSVANILLIFASMFTRNIGL